MTTPLPDILVTNAFNILGLAPSTAMKEIRKRAQKLLQLAKIDELQDFDFDIGHVRKLRDGNSVRQAVERVSNIKDRLNEIFFWFERHSAESQSALRLISMRDYSGALSILEESNQVTTDWLGYKNMALTLLFEALANSSLDSLRQSLKSWKKISESDAFWEFYQSYYLLQDDLGTSADAFKELRYSMPEILSKNVSDFYFHTKNPQSIGVFYSTFDTIGQSIDAEIIQPIVLMIQREIESLWTRTREPGSDPVLITTILSQIHRRFLDLEALLH